MKLLAIIAIFLLVVINAIFSYQGVTYATPELAVIGAVALVGVGLMMDAPPEKTRRIKVAAKQGFTP